MLLEVALDPVDVQASCSSRPIVVRTSSAAAVRQWICRSRKTRQWMSFRWLAKTASLNVGENGDGGSGWVRERHVVKSEFAVTPSGGDLVQCARFPGGAVNDGVQGIGRCR